MNKEKYRADPLFDGCISVNCPDAYECFLDEIILFLRKHNMANGKFNLISIAQVKMKFVIFTVYVTSTDDNYNIPDNVYETLREIQAKALNYCKHCGKKKTEMVIDSRIRKVCFDHFPTRPSRHGS